MGLKTCTCGQACFSCGEIVCDNCGDKASNYQDITQACTLDHGKKQQLQVQEEIQAPQPRGGSVLPLTPVATTLSMAPPPVRRQPFPVRPRPPIQPGSSSECNGCHKSLTDFTCRDRDIFFDLGMCFDCSENNDNPRMMFH